MGAGNADPTAGALLRTRYAETITQRAATHSPVFSGRVNYRLVVPAQVRTGVARQFVSEPVHYAISRSRSRAARGAGDVQRIRGWMTCEVEPRFAIEPGCFDY